MSMYRSHRTFGHLVARVPGPNNEELVILQTSPTKMEASPAHLLLPVSDDELVFEARMALAAAIERIRFLGVDAETLRRLFDEEARYSDT
jgi:hypothetical protein